MNQKFPKSNFTGSLWKTILSPNEFELLGMKVISIIATNTLCAAAVVHNIISNNQAYGTKVLTLNGIISQFLHNVDEYSYMNYK